MAPSHGVTMVDSPGAEALETAEGAALVVDFGGRKERIPAGTTFVIGRGADLAMDDNQYVHRRFLELDQRDGIWWLSNVGSRLTASVASADGMAQSLLAPGESMPLVFSATTVMFTAGPTTYEVEFSAETPFYQVSTPWASTADGADIAGLLSPVQRIVLTALSEPMLRLASQGSVRLPAMDEVAVRLGWSLEKLERRAGSLCDKFARHGIRGLGRDSAGRMPDAVRSRLVEHAVGARIVTPDDLELLEAFDPQGAVAN